MRKISTMEFKKFSCKALEAYQKLIKEQHNVDLKMDIPPELPEFASLLAGTSDAIVTNPINKRRWPVLVKHIWQSNRGIAQTAEEIVKKRKNFYLEQVDGRWQVTPYSSVHYACLNVMRLYGFDFMDLVCYAERSDSVLVVSVKFDREFYTCNAQSMFDLLQRGSEFLFSARP